MNENMMVLLTRLNGREIKRLLRMVTAELQRENAIARDHDLTITELQLMKKHVVMRAAYTWTYRVLPTLKSEIYIYTKLGGSRDDFARGDFIETFEA